MGKVFRLTELKQYDWNKMFKLLDSVDINYSERLKRKYIPNDKRI